MRSFISLVACGCAVLALAASARATTYSYNLNQLSPDQLPGDAGVFTSGLAGGSGDSESVAANNNTLTLVNQAGTRGFYYYKDITTLPLFNSTNQYEIRVRATPTTNYGGSGGGDVPIFTAEVYDGSRLIRFGMSFDNAPQNNYQFYFANTGGSPIPNSSTRHLEPLATAPPFFDVLLRKTGTDGNIGGSLDSVELYVSNVLALTVPYLSFDTATDKQLAWGQTNGSASGTALVNGVTYGINEAAPLITIPEPATVSLLGLGAVIVLRRRRR